MGTPSIAVGKGTAGVFPKGVLGLVTDSGTVRSNSEKALTVPPDGIGLPSAKGAVLTGSHRKRTAGRAHFNGRALREQGVSMRDSRHASHILLSGRSRIIRQPDPDARLNVKRAPGDGVADFLKIS
jgi:hypothetical protein